MGRVLLLQVQKNGVFNFARYSFKGITQPGLELHESQKAIECTCSETFKFSLVEDRI
jgi:hypothetical protein